MSSQIRISNVSTLGQIIHFVRDNSLQIFLSLSILLVIATKSSNKLNGTLKSFFLKNTAPIFMLIATPADFILELKQAYVELTSLRSENKLLKTNNKVLKEKLFSMLYLEEENLHLKELLNFRDSSSLDYQIAKLYLNIDKSFERISIINKGKNSGVFKGQAIVTGNGLVGRVLNSFESYAHVILLSDYQSKIPIYTANSGEKAILIGGGNKSLGLKYLRKNHQLKNNEVIFTSGDGKIYPANIPIGTIILNGNNEITIKPFVDFYKLDFVKILKVKN